MAKLQTYELLLKIFAPFFCLGIIGNLLIVLHFLRVNRNAIKRMPVYHYLVIVLAVNDFIVCAIASFHAIARNTDLYVNKKIRVYLIPFRVAIFCCVSFSIWILVLISFARYRSILYPFATSGKWTKKRYTGIICVTFAILFVILLVQYIPNETNHFLLTLRAFTECIIPLISMCFFYYKIAQYMKRNQENVTQNQQQIHERNRTALKTLKYLILVYFLSVVVVRIFILIIKFNEDYFTDLLTYPIKDAITQTFNCLYYINNVLNVFVHAKMDADFRKFVKNILIWHKRSRK